MDKHFQGITTFRTFFISRTYSSSLAFALKSNFKRIYIGGPMTGLVDFNCNAFHAAKRGFASWS